MEFAGLAITTSSCFRKLYIGQSGAGAKVGDTFMRVLADHHIHSLEKLTLDEKPWFEGGRDGCMQSLVILLARQTNLKLLDMTGKDTYYQGFLTEEQ